MRRLTLAIREFAHALRLLGWDYFRLRHRDYIRYRVSRGLEVRTSVWPQALFLAAVILILVLGGYQLPWTGFGQVGDQSTLLRPAKSLWDWMDLLLVPILLALVAVAFSRAQKEREMSISIIERGADALQQYLRDMSELLLGHGLEEENELATASRTATARTIATLDMLSPTQKGHLVRFLAGAGLIAAENPFIPLQRANLQRMYLDPGSYRGCSLHGANMDLASVSHCSFDKSDLASSTMLASDLGSSTFFQCEMNYIHARHAYLVRARLHDARLLKADFQSADLEDADLRRAKLRSAKFRGANLNRADLQGAQMPYADFRVANLRNANFRGCDLTGANFYGANLRGADFSDADLSRANVTLRQLRSAKSLARASLPAGH
jgi:uncharacterized protein YjbI with pentapeptide repeats